MYFTSSLMGCMSLQTSSGEPRETAPPHAEFQHELLSSVVEAALTITWSKGKNFLNGRKLVACCLTPLSIAFKMSSSYAPHIYIFILGKLRALADRVHLFLIESWNLKCLKGPEKLSYAITYPLKNSIDSPLRLAKRMKGLIYPLC